MFRKLGNKMDFWVGFLFFVSLLFLLQGFTMCIVQAPLGFTEVIKPQPPKCWDYVCSTAPDLSSKYSVVLQIRPQDACKASGLPTELHPQTPEPLISPLICGENISHILGWVLIWGGVSLEDPELSEIHLLLLGLKLCATIPSLGWVGSCPILFCVYLYVCRLWMGMCVCHSGDVRVRGQLYEFILFHQVGPWIEFSLSSLAADAFVHLTVLLAWILNF